MLGEMSVIVGSFETGAELAVYWCVLKQAFHETIGSFLAESRAREHATTETCKRCDERKFAELAIHLRMPLPAGWSFHAMSLYN
jgi:hypothetical protein